MAEEIIEITVHPDGKVEMQVQGIAGMDCLPETEDLIRLLGGEVESREMTGEAYQDAEQREQGRLWQ
jgi:Protein of unknown function (DUF2997)